MIINIYILYLYIISIAGDPLLVYGICDITMISQNCMLDGV